MDLGKDRAPRSSNTGLCGGGPIPLHSIPLGTDYSEMLFGWWCTRHSGDPASWEDSSLRATHCCALHISHRRQRKSQKTTSMLTNLKHFKPSQGWTDLLKSLSKRACPSHSHQQFDSLQQLYKSTALLFHETELLSLKLEPLEYVGSTKGRGNKVGLGNWIS